MGEHGLSQIFDYLDLDRSGDITIVEYSRLYNKGQQRTAKDNQEKEQKQLASMHSEAIKPEAVYAPGEDPAPGERNPQGSSAPPLHDATPGLPGDDSPGPEASHQLALPTPPDVDYGPSMAAASFRLFDKNSDQKVTLAEFLSESGEGSEAAERARGTFKVMDSDGDMLLSVSEFENSGSTLHARRNFNDAGSDVDMSTHHRHFNYVDENKDGQVSRDEISKHMKLLGNANAVMLFGDKNNDGSICRAEYQALFDSPTSKIKQLAHFTGIDRNKDNVLTLDEFVSSATTPASRSLRRWEFHQLDKNIDGKLTFDEVYGIQTSGQETAKSTQVSSATVSDNNAAQSAEKRAEDEHVFEFYEFDKDGDNFLDEQESKNANLHQIRDVDGDGKVSLKEYLASFDPDVVIEHHKEEYLMMDENGDRRIDRREFLKHVPAEPGVSEVMHFRNHDTDRNGWLSFNEIFPGSSAPDWMPPEKPTSAFHPVAEDGDETPDHIYKENHHNFKVLDANGDGKVSQEELIKHIPVPKGMTLESHWKGYDRDRSGSLSFAEIFPNTPVPRDIKFKTVPEHFDHMDQNGDEAIDMREYHYMYGHFKLKSRFVKLDKNKDGKLSFEELHGYKRPQAVAVQAVQGID